MSQITLRPTGAGDETNIPAQVPDSGYHFDKMDEVVADDAATIVSSAAAAIWYRDLYAMADTSQGGTINWVRVYMRVYAAIEGYARTALKSGSTVYEGSVISAPQAWTDYYTQYATMDGVAWTWAKVNAAQAGLSLAGTDAKLSGSSGTQTWLVVDFTDSTPQTLYPSGIDQAQAVGAPSLVLFIKSSGIEQALGVGEPVLAMGALIILPVSASVAASLGVPSLTFPQFISPPGIVQAIIVPEPIVFDVGQLKPEGIAQQISIGSPSLYKYVWHVVLDGQYATETPRINRTYIVGRDQYGNPVYGSAIESSEVDLVGERLDFQQEVAIPTESQAASMATAILGKMRLTKARGVILIPPNCGQELFDVVQISDAGANQSAVSFRVVGIRFEYNPKQARFEHRLILGAP